MWASYQNHFNGTLRQYDSLAINGFARFNSSRSKDTSKPLGFGWAKVETWALTNQRKWLGAVFGTIVWGTIPLKPSIDD
jgi:hypothetical protein